MKRQIIKTRPVAPYRAARIAIVVIVVIALLALLGYLFLPKAHASHASIGRRVAVRQDSAIFLRNSPSPAKLLD